jgi:hypothetical protein
MGERVTERVSSWCMPCSQPNLTKHHGQLVHVDEGVRCLLRDDVGEGGKAGLISVHAL